MELLILILLVSTVYLLPYIVAVVRDLPNRRPIFIANVASGWTIVGWVITLVWVIRRPAPARAKAEVLFPDKVCAFCGASNPYEVAACSSCGRAWAQQTPRLDRRGGCGEINNAPIP